MFQPENTTEVQAKDLLGQQNEIGGVPALQFKLVNTYTTFLVEFTFDGNDIVFHFFRSLERTNDDKFWKETFPNTLSQIAQDYFQATFPRLKASYTEKVIPAHDKDSPAQDSWWLRAYGFVNIGDPEERCNRFFDLLDRELDKASPPLQ